MDREGVYTPTTPPPGRHKHSDGTLWGGGGGCGAGGVVVHCFDWLVNWLDNTVLEGALGVYTLGWSTYKHTQERLDKSHSASKSITKIQR